MMGQRARDQGKLFYEFHLDERIPKNHPLRCIDIFVSAALADLHEELQPITAISDAPRSIPS